MNKWILFASLLGIGLIYTVFLLAPEEISLSVIHAALVVSLPRAKASQEGDGRDGH